MSILPHEQAVTVTAMMLNFGVTKLDIAFGALALLLIFHLITRVSRMSKGSYLGSSHALRLALRVAGRRVMADDHGLIRPTSPPWTSWEAYHWECKGHAHELRMGYISSMGKAVW